MQAKGVKSGEMSSRWNVSDLFTRESLMRQASPSLMKSRLSLDEKPIIIKK